MKNIKKIAYQGLEGSYSHQACKEIFPEGQYNGYKSFYNAVAAVQKEESDVAVLPVENTTAGRVMEVHNLLPDSGLHIIGEYLLPIHHYLMIPRNAFRGNPPLNIEKNKILEWKNSNLTEQEFQEAFSSIIEVRSHPQALAQCRKFIQNNIPKAIAIPAFDTAGAARDISKNKDSKIAAIASIVAAEIYNMVILKEKIEDISTNTTRFLILSKTDNTSNDVAEKAMTTILFDTKHEPGSLIKALQVFESYGINLTKLETYMIGPAQSNPAFYVDIGASIYDDNMKNALQEFSKQTEKYSILGCYTADVKRGLENGFLAI